MDEVEPRYEVIGFRWRGSLHSFPTKEAVEEAVHNIAALGEKPDFMIFRIGTHGSVY